MDELCLPRQERFESWRRSGINPNWDISNFGRVRDRHGYRLLRIRLDQSLLEFVVLARGRRWYRVWDLVAEAWSEPKDPDWFPWLERSYSGKRRDRNRNLWFNDETIQRTYRSVKIASIETGIPEASIRANLAGVSKTAYGHEFVYLDREPEE